MRRVFSLNLMSVSRPLLACLLALAACLMPACKGTKKKVVVSEEALATPAHNMSRGDYPFAADGSYVDAWAAEGATRYRGTIDSDSADSGRSVRVVKKPTAPPRPVARTTSSKKSTASKPKVTSKTKTAAKPKTTAKPAAKSVRHTVKKGDTLYSIARKYGSSVAKIKAANGLKSDSIRDGRTLVVPK